MLENTRWPSMMAMTSFSPPTLDSELDSTSTFQRLARRSACTYGRFSRKERGFVAASAGADFQDDVLLVVGILGQQQNFEVGLNFGQPFSNLPISSLA